MAIASTQITAGGGGRGDAGGIAALAVSDGCANHGILRRLTTTGVTGSGVKGSGVKGRDLADAVHVLCAVHGRLTNLFEEADRRRPTASHPTASDPTASDPAAFDPAANGAWLAAAAAAFGVERAYLARLTAAVGPMPSTPGHAESDAAFAAQRHAFDMLAKSDRAGCAIGAALALAIDWHAFRRILDTAAHRAGVAVTPTRLPDEREIAMIATAPGAPPAVRRAMAFGAQQTFAQHRGLCDLIEARAIARDQV